MAFRYAANAFSRVLYEARDIRSKKVAQYGMARHEIEDAEDSLTLCRSDVYRKTLRLKQLTEDAPSNPKAAEALRDLYLDLLVYAAMGVIEIDRLELTGQRGPSTHD